MSHLINFLLAIVMNFYNNKASIRSYLSGGGCEDVRVIFRNELASGLEFSIDCGIGPETDPPRQKFQMKYEDLGFVKDDPRTLRCNLKYRSKFINYLVAFKAEEYDSRRCGVEHVWIARLEGLYFKSEKKIPERKEEGES